MLADAQFQKAGYLLMSKLVPLDNVEHAQLRFAEDWDRHAAVNLALVVPPEFEQIQREYPVLFRRDEEGEFQAVVILGLDRGENLFVKDGEWKARYIPATLRRGPFFLGTDEDTGTSSILVDLDDLRVSETDGEPLYLPLGGATPVLEQIADALGTIQAGLPLSETMFAMFLEMGLIAPVEIDVDFGDGTHYRLPDFFNISVEALRDLSAEALERLNRAGFLSCAIQARSSLGNMNRLIELKADKRATSLHA